MIELGNWTLWVLKFEEFMENEQTSLLAIKDQKLEDLKKYRYQLPTILGKGPRTTFEINIVKKCVDFTIAALLEHIAEFSEFQEGKNNYLPEK